jgi:hypothetical protein
MRFTEGLTSEGRERGELIVPEDRAQRASSRLRSIHRRSEELPTNKRIVGQPEWGKSKLSKRILKKSFFKPMIGNPTAKNGLESSRE